jgi:4-hydroxyphenylpyruvate dioxygenase
MPFAFSTLNNSVNFGLPPELPRQIALAAAAGYDYIGIDVATVLAHEADGTPVEAIADALQAAGAPCHELVPLWISDDLSSIEHDVDEVLRLARALQPRVVQLIVSAAPSDPVRAAAANAVQRFADAGFASAVEPVAGWGVATMRDGLEFVRGLPVPVGLVVDSWQYLRAEPDWTALRELDVADVSFAQFCDGRAEPMPDLNVEMAGHRRIPGDGAFPLTTFVDAFTDKGYAGVVSIEVLDEAWRSRPLEEFVELTLERSRSYWAGSADGR